MRRGANKASGIGGVQRDGPDNAVGPTLVVDRGSFSSLLMR